MAIQNRKKTVKAAPLKDKDSTSTHFRNETTTPDGKAGAEALNNQTANDLLIDPEDTPGSTHFDNEEEFSEKTNRMNGKPVKAAVKPAPKKAVKAKKAVAADLDDDEFDEADDPDMSQGPDADGDFEEGDDPDFIGGSEEEEACETAPGDTQHFRNGIDPAEGYLTVGEADDEDFEDDDEEVDASEMEGSELEHGETGQQMLEADTEFDDEEPEGEPEEVEDEAIDEEEEDEPTMAKAGNGDSMNLVDINGVDDTGEDAVFASFKNRLHVIKAGMIVASMGRKMAVKAGHGGHYLSDQFQEVVEVEMSKHGLRAGLQKMGFAFAKVNVATNDVVNKRVEAKATRVTAAVRRNAQISRDSMGQCMAIAAVGINRAFFKEFSNPLKATLVSELESAGLKGANRLVARVMKQQGVEYAKSIITLAAKISELPEAVRNQYVAALDMTSDGTEDTGGMEDDDDLYGDEASPDFQSEYADVDDEEGDDEDGEFENEFEDEIEAPSSVHAALSRPIHRKEKQRVSASKTGYNTTTAAILNGDAPLPFARF